MRKFPVTIPCVSVKVSITHVDVLSKGVVVEGVVGWGWGGGGRLMRPPKVWLSSRREWNKAG